MGPIRHPLKKSAIGQIIDRLDNQAKVPTCVVRKGGLHLAQLDACRAIYHDADGFGCAEALRDIGGEGAWK